MSMLNKEKVLQALWISFYDKGYAPEQNNIFKARLINTLTTLQNSVQFKNLYSS